MTSQAPWSPTAQAFAHHQFSHVTNFRKASFQLDALPGGQARLNLTFQLPSTSEVVPPPSHVFPVPPQRPIHPLFPNGYFPQGSADTKTRHASPKKVSSRQRKSYQRSVLHRAALAVSSLPPPKNGSLRQAALACLQHPQTPYTESSKKCPAALLSPPNLSPLAQRIRSDIQIGESEVESPEKELLRSSPCPENSPLPISHCMKSLPSPAPVPLVFTPGPVPPEKSRCLNCEAEMTPEHQCEAKDSGAFPPDSVSYTPPGSPNRTIGKRIFPKKYVKEAEMEKRSRVKCCVCACLGRETSMVLLGS